MDKFEKYVIDNKSLFEEEPQSGHFDRLQQKMNRKSGLIVALSWSISVAASIAIVLLISIMLQNNRGKDDFLALCENADDMKLCYMEKMNEVAGQIEILTKDFDLWERQEVLTEVHEIINTADSGFDIDIPEELPENQAKEILSDYYRQNLESLEMIADELRIEN